MKGFFFSVTSLFMKPLEIKIEESIEIPDVSRGSVNTTDIPPINNDLNPVVDEPSPTQQPGFRQQRLANCADIREVL